MTKVYLFSKRSLSLLSQQFWPFEMTSATELAVSISEDPFMFCFNSSGRFPFFFKGVPYIISPIHSHINHSFILGRIALILTLSSRCSQAIKINFSLADVSQQDLQSLPSCLQFIHRIWQLIWNLFGSCMKGFGSHVSGWIFCRNLWCLAHYFRRLLESSQPFF